MQSFGLNAICLLMQVPGTFDRTRYSLAILGCDQIDIEGPTGADGVIWPDNWLIVDFHYSTDCKTFEL